MDTIGGRRLKTEPPHDGDLMDPDVEALAMETGLLDLLVDGGYTNQGAC